MLQRIEEAHGAVIGDTDDADDDDGNDENDDDDGVGGNVRPSLCIEIIAKAGRRKCALHVGEGMIVDTMGPATGS